MQLKDIHPAIVDQAILFLENGNYRFSCNALDGAALKLGYHYSDRKSMRLLYERHVCNGYTLYWWGRADDFKEERIQALESFKQAILEAAE